MSPRPGGEADKLGNRYELAWAIRHALSCVLDDQRALTVEDNDVELGLGSEFTYETGGIVEVYQVKRQNRNSNSWTVRTLANMKIFETAAKHVAANRNYHFVSLTPCRPLQELSDRARRAEDLTSFIQRELTVELRPVFDQLSAAEVLGSSQSAWDTLRGMWFSVHDEKEIISTNSMVAGLSFSGATGDLISLAIGDILLDNLGKRLTRTELLEKLAEKGIKPLPQVFYQTAHEQTVAVTNSWRKSVQRGLLQPPIKRVEAKRVVEALDSGQIGLIVGTAGGGKSSVLEQAVSLLESTGSEVLALRLDRCDQFASTAELGRQIGLETSPALALARAARGRAAFLVIDQLDAVSLASGRIPNSFDVVRDLIDEALCVKEMHVVLACRQFDIDNDERLRELASSPDVTKVEVGLLTVEDVDIAVASMGLDPTHLTPSQRNLLRTPLHLVLLQAISSQADALAFQSKGSLFESFWRRKRQDARARREKVRFNDVITRIANVASNRQILSVPIEIFDDGELIEDANVLVSEHVLVEDSGRIAFFHEAFFDYAFARLWVSRDESLVDFLRPDEQALFRRAQVRQILQHLYEREPDRFRLEVEAVLASDDIRFHIKETVLAVVGSLVEPTSADVELVLRMAATHLRFKAHLWQQLRRPQWFSRFYKDGQIIAWLEDPDENIRDHALNLMVSAVNEYPETVVALLVRYKGRPEYLDWLSRVSRSADIWQDRQLFDLVLEAVRQGIFDVQEHELWLMANTQEEFEPLWGIELLEAWLIDRDEAWTLDDRGKVAVLGIWDSSAAELIKKTADVEPLAFVQTIVPYLRQIMAATAMDSCEDKPIRDEHFTYRFRIDDLDDDELGNALLSATVHSLETLAERDPEAIRSLLDELADDSYDASQFLLYRALTAGAEYFASWAASLLLEGDWRLECGYISDAHWVARELVRAIAPHVTDVTHQQLENSFRDLRNEYKERHKTGYMAFKLLSALEESRLSSVGRRRLGEYRRKFKEDTPEKPRCMTTGVIGSPIASEAAEKMTDAQWLNAMVKHDSDKRNWIKLTGGARELSRELEKQTAVDPVRFARLSLRVTSEFNAAYTSALLRGFGDAGVTDGAGALIFDAVRHIASLRQEDNDRWIGRALQKYYREVPLDLVELILDRALNAPDPTDDRPVSIRDGKVAQSAEDLRTQGINTARGSLAETLGDLLINDSDGQRTALVAPYLDVMASDPVLSVRSCVAHTLAASLRDARPEVLGAFSTLIKADDLLLATDLVERLILYIGNVNPEVIDPIIQRMLVSEEAEVREAGGRIAAFAALEWERPELMRQALEGDLHVRKGIAQVAVWRVEQAPNTVLATETLIRLMADDTKEVREEAAKVASHLRGRPLQPFIPLLAELIDSPAYKHATSQVVITLEDSHDRVDDLILKVVQRFVDVCGKNAADIGIGEAAGAYRISKLVVRGLAQCRDQGRQAALLDVLDRLLELGVFGAYRAIEKLERS